MGYIFGHFEGERNDAGIERCLVNRRPRRGYREIIAPCARALLGRGASLGGSLLERAAAEA